MSNDYYEVDKTLCKDEYSIFNTSQERYIAENLKKQDAELIACALNNSDKQIERIRSISENYIKLLISHIEVLDTYLPEWRIAAKEEIKKVKELLKK